MSDDIVTRLRDELLIIEQHGTESLNDLDHADLLIDAADEIEWLQAEIKWLQAELKAVRGD